MVSSDFGSPSMLLKAKQIFSCIKQPWKSLKMLKMVTIVTQKVIHLEESLIKQSFETIKTSLWNILIHHNYSRFMQLKVLDLIC